MSVKEKRIAVIDHDRCKPKKCDLQCKLKCPVNQSGKNCIEVEKTVKFATISEDMCIDCGQCARVCPFGAVQIVKLPTQIQDELVFSYGENSFRLYKLPIPKQGSIVGFIGQNGIGKSTLLNILCGKIKPNFGDFKAEANEKQILQMSRGTELQNYLKELYAGNLTVKMKPQNIDTIIGQVKKQKISVLNFMKKYLDSSVFSSEWFNTVIDELNLNVILNSEMHVVSGGELQRVLCSIVLLQKADVYIFDEPTNYLDVRQRLNVARLIRQISKPENYVFIVEHDMSILDYTSDYVSILYGTPGAFGAISSPHATGNAVNMFFTGYIKADNMRFRSQAYSFKEALTVELEEPNSKKNLMFAYEAKEITYGSGSASDGKNDRGEITFSLSVEGGSFTSSAILVLLGKNGTGKTSFLNYIAENIGLSVSYKRQYPDIEQYIKYRNNKSYYPTVLELLQFPSGLFLSDVILPLDIKRLYDRKINKLSGGELQRVLIAYCLAQKADLYLIDEPSANLDIEFRAILTRVIKRFTMHHKKCCFVVEHDIMMAMSLAMEKDSKIVVFSEENTNENDNKRFCRSSKPLCFEVGINTFLKQLNITFRSDKTTKRPRINKLGSNNDREQKAENKYYM